ncbi:ataxin-1-like [Adelges cooleyi]|uniref:ataxin-1-like n=1 Tax=Adelges cooleyi TaxID=133065 RepID=UPI00217FE465|nr:ataxin-1-like [Adelges cooleyi]
MITSGLVVDGVGHGLPTHLPYNHHHPVVHSRMSYMEQSYMKAVPAPSPQSSEPVSATPEFLRPLPKPAPVNPLKAPRASKYPPPPQPPTENACRPVNLTQAKEPPPPPEHLRLDDRHHPYTMYGHPRLYVSASPYHPYPMPAPYGVYTSPYAPVLPRDARHLMQPPQERRYPSPPTKSTARTSPSSSSSPPEQFKVPNGRVDNKQTTAQQRILQPPHPVSAPAAAAEPPVKRPRTTPEPPSPPAKTSNFTKGSLIRLANGNIKKVEDMRTEDFLSSVENSDQHRIDPSTVVRIEPVTDAKENVIRITLSYGDQRNQVGADAKRTSAACKSHQVEMESGAEHPYFVFGRGWASWSPAKTLARYGLTCQRLQVGDVCVSLTKRTAAAAVTEATVTVNAAVHGKRRSQLQVTAVQQQQQQQQPQHHHHHHHHQPQPQPPPPPQADDDKTSAGRNKRRWSAPDPEPAT